MAFHSEHHFEGFHLQMPSAARPLTGSQGLVDQPSSVTESVIGDRIGSPPVGDDLPSLSHMAASHEPLPVWDVKIVVYIVIVRENHCGTAHMCRDVQMHIFEDPPFRGALGSPQLQSRLARCIWRRPSEMPRVPLDGNCAGRPMTLVSWRPMASRPRISCKREQSRPLAHVALSPPPKQTSLGTRSLLSRKSADSCANLIFCSGPFAPLPRNPRRRSEEETKMSTLELQVDTDTKAAVAAVRFVLAY